MEILNRNIYKGGVKGAIFDWAGTTVDFGCFAPVKAFVDTFAKNNVDVTIDEVRAPMGLHKKEHIREIAKVERVSGLWMEKNNKMWDEDDIHNMFVDFIPSLMNIVGDYSSLVPGVLEAQKEIRDRGLFLGTTTGYNNEIMEIVINKAASEGYKPDYVVCASEVPAGRPSPSMIFKNMIQNKIYPVASVIKIGDTISDIKEGTNAGCWSVGVIDSSNELGLTKEEFDNMPSGELSVLKNRVKEKFENAGAHLVINNLFELPAVLDKINEQLSQGERP